MAQTKAQTASAVPARATQGAEARNWSWVEASVWTERMVSALANGVKGGRWYSLMDKVYAPDTLDVAWERVGPIKAQRAWMAKASSGSRRTRNCIWPSFRRHCGTAVTGRSRSSGRIPKGDGKTRPLGIPTVKDRIVQTAVKFALEPIFEATFRPTSYGFRPGRGCRDALREVLG